MGRTVLLIDLEADLNASISLGVRPSNARPSIAEVLLQRGAPGRRGSPGRRRAKPVLITGSPALARMDSSLRNVARAGTPARRRHQAAGAAVRHDRARLAGRLFAARAQRAAGGRPADRADPRGVPVARIAGAVPVAGIATSRPTRKATARLAGILLTMVDYRRQATREIVDIIRLHNRRGVFAHRDSAGSARRGSRRRTALPLVHYAPASRGSRAYRQFTAELVTRIRAPRSR